MKKMSLKNITMLFLTAFIWGVAFVAQSVGMNYIGPFTFSCVRSILGGIVLIPCIWFLDRLKMKEEGVTEKRTMSEKEKKTLLIGGICCGIALCVASNLQQFGVKYTTVGKAGFITALYIVLVPIFGIFLKKKVGVKVWISVAISVVGLYLLCMTEKFSISKGDFLVLLCAIVFSIHILVIDHFSPLVDGVRMSCIQFWITGIISAIPMFLFEKPSLSAIFAAAVPLLYAGVMSSGVAYTLQIVAQKDADPTVASLILSLESVFSVLAGWVVLGQVMSMREICGCVLMFAAIILAQLPERKTVQP
ncbi:DMT family transporter [Bariatricus sp. HCP28S3_C2]|uniref:DMT family transporter n=1 Tax=unclassified Bariatricus TaxID=2677046 RepID=UPI003F8A5ECC